MGLSATSAAGLLAGFNLSSAAGRIGFGQIADYLGPINSLILALAWNAISLLVIWPVSTSLAPLIIFVVINGMCNGGFYSCIPTAVGSITDSSRLASAMGLLVTGWAGGYLMVSFRVPRREPCEVMIMIAIPGSSHSRNSVECLWRDRCGFEALSPGDVLRRFFDLRQSWAVGARAPQYQQKVDGQGVIGKDLKIHSRIIAGILAQFAEITRVLAEDYGSQVTESLRAKPVSIRRYLAAVSHSVPEPQSNSPRVGVKQNRNGYKTNQRQHCDARATNLCKVLGMQRWLVIQGSRSPYTLSSFVRERAKQRIRLRSSRETQQLAGY
jgi:hypothetical protein